MVYFSIERDTKEGGTILVVVYAHIYYETFPENHYSLIPLTTKILRLLVNNTRLPHCGRRWRIFTIELGSVSHCGVWNALFV